MDPTDPQKPSNPFAEAIAKIPRPGGQRTGGGPSTSPAQQPSAAPSGDPWWAARSFSAGAVPFGFSPWLKGMGAGLGALLEGQRIKPFHIPSSGELGRAKDTAREAQQSEEEGLQAADQEHPNAKYIRVAASAAPAGLAAAALPFPLSVGGVLGRIAVAGAVGGLGGHLSGIGSAPIGATPGELVNNMADQGLSGAGYGAIMGTAGEGMAKGMDLWTKQGTRAKVAQQVADAAERPGASFLPSVPGTPEPLPVDQLGKPGARLLRAAAQVSPVARDAASAVIAQREGALPQSLRDALQNASGERPMAAELAAKGMTIPQSVDAERGPLLGPLYDAAFNTPEGEPRVVRSPKVLELLQNAPAEIQRAMAQGERQAATGRMNHGQPLGAVDPLSEFATVGDARRAGFTFPLQFSDSKVLNEAMAPQSRQGPAAAKDNALFRNTMMSQPENQDIMNRFPTVDAINRMKGIVDQSLIPKPGEPGFSKQAKTDLSTYRNRILTAVDKGVPEYARARGIAQPFMKMDEAGTIGESLLSQPPHATEAQLQALRLHGNQPEDLQAPYGPRDLRQPFRQAGLQAVTDALENNPSDLPSWLSGGTKVQQVAMLAKNPEARDLLLQQMERLDRLRLPASELGTEPNVQLAGAHLSPSALRGALYGAAGHVVPAIANIVPGFKYQAQSHLGSAGQALGDFLLRPGGLQAAQDLLAQRGLDAITRARLVAAMNVSRAPLVPKRYDESGATAGPSFADAMSRIPRPQSPP